MSQTPHDAPKEAPKEKKKGNAWVENLESLVVAVILALIIRTFVLEAFVIPSGSMAATLYGNHFEITCENCGYHYALGYNSHSVPSNLETVRCLNCGFPATELPRRAAGGDRILVNKTLYRFDGPERWDPFVFVNPTVRATDPKPHKTTYIKRLVGMPGETLEIIRGDVYINGKIARKSRSALKSLWMPVYDSRYVWKKEGDPWKHPKAGWSLNGTALEADVPEGKLAFTKYAGRIGRTSGTIRDDYPYDRDLTASGSGLSVGAGLNVVRDLRVSCDVTAVERPGRIILSLQSDGVEDNAVIDLAEGMATLMPSGKAPASNPIIGRWTAGKPHTVSLERLDGMLNLVIDGMLVIGCSASDPAEYRAWVQLGRAGELHGFKSNAVAIGAEGVKLRLENVRIDRDIFYTPRNQRSEKDNQYQRYEIPEGKYLALGDNSPESSDGRYWGLVPAENLLGKAFIIWWHPLRIRMIH